MGRHSAPGVATLGWATLVRSLGSGGVLTLAVLFFVQYRGLPAGHVGLALTVGGFAGVAASLPLGKLANGPRSRDVAAVAVAGQGLAVLAFLLVGSLPALVLAACAASVTEAGSNAARAVLVAGLVTGPERVQVRAKLRAVTNAGSAAAAACSGFVLSVDVGWLWNASLVLCAAYLLAAGGLLRLVPRPAAVQVPLGSHRWEVLRDRPYALLAVLNAVLTMNLGLLTVALPVWVASRTDVPTGVFGGLILLNTVLVVLFQVRVARDVTDLPSAVRAVRRCGLLLAVCCGFFAAAAGLPPVVAVVVLVLGGGAHALGEMVFSAGTWELSYAMAPEHAHGQYQGMFGMSSQLGNALAPAVTVGLVVALGAWGWLLLGVLLAVSGAAAAALPAMAGGRRASGRAAA